MAVVPRHVLVEFLRAEGGPWSGPLVHRGLQVPRAPGWKLVRRRKALPLGAPHRAYCTRTKPRIRLPTLEAVTLKRFTLRAPRGKLAQVEVADFSFGRPCP